MAGGHSGGATGAKSSMFSTFMNLVKPFVGAGILALPHAFMTGGLLASIVLMALMAAMANYCIRCLLECLVTLSRGHEDGEAAIDSETPPLLSPLVDSKRGVLRHPTLDNIDPSSVNNAVSLRSRHWTVENPPSFREIGEVAYGAVGKYAVDVNLILSQLGFCTAYMAFMGENLHSVWPRMSYNEWIGVMMAMLSILCQMRSVSSIAFTSMLGNAIYLVCITIIFVDGFQHQCCLDGSGLKWVDFAGLPAVFGTACFALEGIGLILPVKAAMQIDKQHRFYSLLNGAIMLVAACYIVFGSLGYAFYGNNVNATITINLTAGIASDSVRVSLSLSLFFSFILQMFPVVDITDYATWYSMKSSTGADSSVNTHSGSGNDGALVEQAESRHTAKLTFSMVVIQSLLRVGAVCLTGLIAITVSNFGLLVSLTGSLANSMIAFILPSLFYVRLIVYVRQPRPFASWQSLQGYVLPVTVVVLGVTASIIGVYSALTTL